MDLFIKFLDQIITGAIPQMSDHLLNQPKTCHINNTGSYFPTFSNREAQANSVDQDQTALRGTV